MTSTRREAPGRPKFEVNRNTFLILSQVYVPDPASLGQHMADAAVEMARRGYRVVVLTSARGYDDPARRYRSREVRDGVEIKRLPLSSYGKSSLFLRLLGAAVFLVQATVRGLFVRDVACVLVSTSPPMCAAAALIIAAVRRIPIKYWVMDLNPDQMLELGRIGERSLAARLCNLLNLRILGSATDIVVLDRFMAERLNRKRDVSRKVTVLPPWPHENHLRAVDHDCNPFRPEHGLEGRFVIMHSGNHGLSMPLTTILQAAVRLQDAERLRFLFVGGGLGKRQVEATRAKNIVSLPYQPFSRLGFSLSAADVHLVVMNDSLVGVVHPCKVYGAMAVARPILLLGPTSCHVSEILQQCRIGWHIHHGDVDGAVDTIRDILTTPAGTLRAMGLRAREIVDRRFSMHSLCGRFCDVLERGVT